MVLNFVEDFKENEVNIMGFKTYDPILVGGVYLTIKANSMSKCTPQEDLELEKYEAIEISLVGKGAEEMVEGVFDNYQKENDSIVVAHAPLEKVELLYNELTLKSKKTTKETSVESLVEKFKTISDSLNKKFYERESQIEGMLVSLLSRQHIFLVGSPGTGKSAISSEFSNIVNKGNYFQWLMTSYTTPEEILGALNFKKLEKGVHERNTEGKLPEAQLAFLDEIFKSNSAILNSLLTLINERLFYNNGAPVETPLISLVGASNEYPEDGEGLEALFDRLLLRYEVEEIKDRDNYISMLKGINDNLVIPSISLEELEQAQKIVQDVVVPHEFYEIVTDIVHELRDEGINPSSRRVKSSFEAIKAKAFLDNRNSVKLSDLHILEHILWNDIEEKEVSVNIIKHYAQDVLESALEQIKKEMDEIEEQHQNNKESADVVMEVNQKIKYLLTDLQELYNKYPGRETEIQEIETTIVTYQKKIVNAMLSPIPF